MDRNILYSLLLHLLVLLLCIFGLPSINREINRDYAIVADVVPISELTNVNVQKKAKPSEDKKETKVHTAKETHNAPEEKVEQKVAEPKEKNTDKNDEKVEPIKSKDKKEKPQENKKAETKKTTKVQSTKKKQDFASSILKSLEQGSKFDEKKKSDHQLKDLEKKLLGETNKQYNPNLPMSISEIDGIKGQITKVWNTAAFSGAADKGMQVTLLLTLDIDGNVVDIKRNTQNNSSEYYRSFVESAVRAVKLASPLQNLTKEKFHQWKDMELRFDSTGMIY